MRYAVDGKPLLGFVGYSGSGKTTLLRAVIGCLQRRALRPAVVKHAHARFDIDHPGKDSYELRHGGAAQVIVASARRHARITETPEQPEADFDAVLDSLDLTNIDLVLVEGFRDECFPKLEVWRGDVQRTDGRPLLALGDTSIIALISDVVIPGAEHLARLPGSDADAVADYIAAYCRSFDAPLEIGTP